MDKLDIACEKLGPLLNNLAHRGLTIIDLRILIALNRFGEVSVSHLMLEAGFKSVTQSHVTKLVKKRLVESVTIKRVNGVGQKRYGYSISRLGIIALKKALKEIT